MTEEILGQVLPVMKGNYDETVSYTYLDEVLYQGSTFICIADCKGQSPTNKDYWNMLASKGEQGIQGIPGPRGLPGSPGSSGIDGKSAYQIAIDNGFKGTINDWLASLKGTDGKDGTNGKDAAAPSFSFAPVKTLPAGDSASAQVTQSGNNYTISFALPAGEAGKTVTPDLTALKSAISAAQTAADSASINALSANSNAGEAQSAVAKVKSTADNNAKQIVDIASSVSKLPVKSDLDNLKKTIDKELWNDATSSVTSSQSTSWIAQSVKDPDLNNLLDQGIYFGWGSDGTNKMKNIPPGISYNWTLIKVIQFNGQKNYVEQEYVELGTQKLFIRTLEGKTKDGNLNWSDWHEVGGTANLLTATNKPKLDFDSLTTPGFFYVWTDTDANWKNHPTTSSMSLELFVLKNPGDWDDLVQVAIDADSNLPSISVRMHQNSGWSKWSKVGGANSIQTLTSGGSLSELDDGRYEINYNASDSPTEQYLHGMLQVDKGNTYTKQTFTNTSADEENHHNVGDVFERVLVNGTWSDWRQITAWN